jgi:hypothetical protein
MLIAFGVISLTMGDFTMSMLPITILMFVAGFYLSRKGITGLLGQMGQPEGEKNDFYGKEKFCPDCGTEISPGQAFCGGCGKKL